MHAIMGGMDVMTMTNDAEIDFEKMMMMSHQGAINMANAELQSEMIRLNVLLKDHRWLHIKSLIIKLIM